MAEKEAEPGKSVLVIGAGITGMQAALDLAAMNHRVYLLERSATIGGNMTRLDKTFPTNDCSMCMISPRMVACARHPLITTHTLCELVRLDGEAGRFTATVRRHPRYVDEKVCIGCRQCADKCPKKVPNAFNANLDERRAIYFVQSQAIPMVPAIDSATCIYFQKGRCRLCEKICPTQAIRFDEKPYEFDLQVGAVVLAGGYEPALVPQAGEYGYARYPNVVTNMDYERMLSATGPYTGHVKRPSDGAQPRKIAWIQCVASRDSARNRNFCSSVCCMAAVKQALLTREHYEETECTIFYMDIRAQGKDFDRYVLRARDSYGVRFIRSMLSQVIQNPANENLLIEYYDHRTLEHHQEEFDLVVLSAGMKPSTSTAELLERLGIERNNYGFVAPDMEQPSRTSQEGIFVCGALDGPKDIPESVTGAGAAAASVAAFLSVLQSIRQGGESPDAGRQEDVPEGTVDTDVPKLQPPSLNGLASSVPRIGVFICHCGKNIAGVVDVENLCRHAAELPNVVVAEHFLFTCSTQTQERIKSLIHEHSLNRIVVAACSPRTHEPLFRETLQQAGLNKYLFEMANIRDQCAWVHGSEHDAATEKAEQLLKGAVARAALLEPVNDVVTSVLPRALVVGGGLAGMTAALNLADQGIPVTLVEKETRLGGMALEIHHTLEGHSPQRIAENLALRVLSHRNITLHTGTVVKSIAGGAGRFEGKIMKGGSVIPADFGAVIIATGGQPYRPGEYFYGGHPGVLTQLELEKHLFTSRESVPGITVMIQCVGSRRDDFPLCSRVCCSAAVKNAIRIKEMNPRSAVYVLYRDIRTYGFKEDYYKRARDLGVMFIKFEPELPPEVEIDGDRLLVNVFDPTSRMILEIRPDFLVLSSGVRPRPEAEGIARMLKLPLMQEGFFMEAHPKLNPVDFSSAGIFLCGLAHSPRFMEETFAQAKAVAARAAGLLLQKEIHTSGVVAEVIPERCSSCLMCVYSCPYNVPVMDPRGVSVIDPGKCQGCGICVAECPAKAIGFKHYTDEQLIAQTHALSAVGG